MNLVDVLSERDIAQILGGLKDLLAQLVAALKDVRDETEIEITIKFRKKAP